MSSEDHNLTDLLRQTRERRGETLDQIHQATGISLLILHGLEEGDFQVVEPVYMRLAADACGQYLGLDRDLVLELYDAASGHAIPERVPVRVAPGEVAITSAEAFPRPSLGRVDLLTRLKTLPPAQIVIAAAILAAIVFLIYALSSGSDASPSTASASQKVEETPGVDAQPPPETVALMKTRELPPVAAASPRADAPTPAAESPGAAEGDAAALTPAAPSDEPSPDGPAAAAGGAAQESLTISHPAAVVTLLPSESADTDSGDTAGGAGALGEAATAPLVLSAHAVDSTWVQVFWDGSYGVTETIPQGENRSWQASEFFMVRAGRAHGVHFTFLGELLGDGRLGEATKVLRFRASREGVVLLGPDQNPLTSVAQAGGPTATSGGLAQP